jgi:hypothetical protein
MVSIPALPTWRTNSQSTSTSSIHSSVNQSINQSSRLGSFYVIHINLLIISNCLAIFKTEKILLRRGNSCNNIRSLARAIGIEQIYFISDIEVRDLQNSSSRSYPGSYYHVRYLDIGGHVRTLANFFEI